MSDIIKMMMSTDPIDQRIGRLQLSLWMQRESRRLIAEGGNR